MKREDFYKKVISSSRETNIIYIGELFKDQTAFITDKGYSVTKLLSILMTGFPGFYGDFGEDGDYYNIYFAISEYLPKVSRPANLYLESGVILSGEYPEATETPVTELLSALFINSIETIFGKKYEDLIEAEYQAYLTSLEAEPELEYTEYTDNEPIDIMDYGYLRLNGDRLSRFNDFCYFNGFDPENVNVQIVYVVNELLFDSQFRLNKLLATQPYEESIRLFSNYYLNNQDDIEGKVQFAEDIYYRLFN